MTSRHETTGQKSAQSGNPIDQSLTNGNGCNGQVRSIPSTPARNSEHDVSTRTEVEEIEVSQNEPNAHKEAVTEDKPKDYTTYPPLGIVTVPSSLEEANMGHVET